ncbi:MAG TPA: hypothetical protein VGO34_06390 [Alphaproteobacteria bacterium]|jgi:hypothetical protein
MKDTDSFAKVPSDGRPEAAPGSGIVVVIGVVAVTSMIFGFLIGLLF